jgi:hypothetical protein
VQNPIGRYSLVSKSRCFLCYFAICCIAISHRLSPPQGNCCQKLLAQQQIGLLGSVTEKNLCFGHVLHAKHDTIQRGSLSEINLLWNLQIDRAELHAVEGNEWKCGLKRHVFCHVQKQNNYYEVFSFKKPGQS